MKNNQDWSNSLNSKFLKNLGLSLSLVATILLGWQLSSCSVQKHVPVVGAGAIQQSTQEFTGQVIAVTDGDTIRVKRDGEIVKIRLNGVDAPESKQVYGPEAKQFTFDRVFNKFVTIHVKDVDRYRRLVANVILEDGRSLNQELVRAGLAWWYEKYAPKDELLQKLQQEARAMKKGLWQQENPTPPWEFRRK